MTPEEYERLRLGLAQQQETYGRSILDRMLRERAEDFVQAGPYTPPPGIENVGMSAQPYTPPPASAIGNTNMMKLVAGTSADPYMPKTYEESGRKRVRKGVNEDLPTVGDAARGIYEVGKSILMYPLERASRMGEYATEGPVDWSQVARIDDSGKYYDRDGNVLYDEINAASEREQMGRDAAEFSFDMAADATLGVGASRLLKTGRAFDPNDMLTANMFAGQQSFDPPKADLDRAKKMLADGADLDTVRKATGWDRGIGGHWQYEIDDRGLNLKDGYIYNFKDALGNKVTSDLDARTKIYNSGGVSGGINGRLNDLIDHPALFAQYPELKRAHVKIVDSGGRFNGAFAPNSNRFYLDIGMLAEDQDTIREVIAHEIQHGIQKTEGWSVGTSPSSNYPAGSMDQIAAKTRMADEFMQGTVRPRMQEYFGSLGPDESAGVMSKLLKRTPKEEVELYKSVLPEDEFRRYLQLRRYLPTAKGKSYADPFEFYRRNAGEVQARNTASQRLDMSPEERRAIGWRETQDVPEDFQWTSDGGSEAISYNIDPGGLEGRPYPTLEDVYKARADEMAKKPADRIQPDPNRVPYVDSDYATPPPDVGFEDLSKDYPRQPEGWTGPLPKNDRARVLVDRRDEIASRLAEKVKATGQLDQDTRYFYHSDGPLFRAARKAGLKMDEAKKWLKDFSNMVAATSPRTQVEPNVRNATSVMAKEAQGIPFRSVVGPGTVDPKTGVKGLSEKGYPMIAGKSGLHGMLIDEVQRSGKINTNTNPKPANFGPNLAGNRSGVTVDTHAIRATLQTLNEMAPGSVPDDFILPKFREAYWKDPSVLTPNMIDDALGSQMINGTKMQTEYPVFADIWHRAAEQLGVDPAEMQSMGWFGLGGDTNLGSDLKTVASVFDERLNVTAQKLGLPIEKVAEMVFRREIPLLSFIGGAAMAPGLMQQPQERQM